jgi:hypothetical protein
MLAAVAWSAWRGIDAGTFRFFNFFGYFTIQNNLIGATALLLAAPRTGLVRPQWLEYLRACAATYLQIVVTVYWTLLAPTEEGSLTEWTNLVMHGLSGVALVADWLLEGPRRTLPLRNVWVVLLYPVAWAVVVLIRGATDGWFPYPFLDPANGYASIAVVVAGIFVAGIAIGSLMFKLTRWRVVVPDPA